ncbi:DNA polymerase III subunit gamma/tau [Pseudomonas coronafaciens pv. porri]|uniref:DNA polymerase III subunit gamma/tau n=1 Tax=Pseudomonas coronafaciens pv. porri TaxID=83964 RepID=A0ABR5JIX2_9PSED|nr:DNA polymerase III subunit gamma/tau [Pseudomonas coronafaciens]KOP53621.1 DNA polymerase III subunit gamma/tau [Pseudomonas coronafaciens pv. porri]KOP57965.1 DNA polymerase III subunit gamma/tau [Pseudomonas coronafaciens pv. porri]KPY26338.1 DNA polymerase III subunit gamma/tau [Pseudomonas coronafaciens pv. porri]RMU84864.1 DNA polymerase III subunit gamma/tau [Pseudomonas coronafaciens pv. porri]RMV97596.1 DNA polymerase III subunit gamma/tau [Pseudomonas coronafaciens pv. porri]
MSYQVLARKWRPRSFREMVGQAHVLKALINALDSQRLHHAYLFTGTRGVGKTTIARIIAKCLNCETGITSTPCGTCSVCKEIDEGRFVDLIEIDAASRTKVEDTRELLDNVQYAPSRGRFKVYLIDEVHMLSSHSFNALLKTLEEPPPYVKFILATTDPQKLPATILSRCLQFSLKNMTPERVVEHLTHVLGVENVPFEDDALWLLGRAADGSMRDAMSLTDQAIAFGEGKVMAADVRAMLGTLDHGQVFDVLTALLEGDARGVLEAVRHLAEQGPDWSGVLSEILNVLHRVAIAQALPEGVDNGHGDRDRVLALAQALPAEDVQFYYQMCLIGRRDLPLAPDPRGGFEMVLLRMLAFRPADSEDAPRQPLKPVGISQATVDSRKAVADATPVASAAPVAPVMAAPDPAFEAVPPAAPVKADATPAAQPVPKADLEPKAEPVEEVDLPWNEPKAPAAEQPAEAEPAAEADPVVEPVLETLSAQPDLTPMPSPAPASPVPDAPEAEASQSAVEEHAASAMHEAIPDSAYLSASVNAAPMDREDEPPADDDYVEPDIDIDPASYSYLDELAHESVVELEAVEPEPAPAAMPATGLAAEWLEVFPKLPVSGMTGSIAANCTLISVEGDDWLLHLDPAHSALFNSTQQRRLNDALNQYHGRTINLSIELIKPEQETPAQAASRLRAERQRQAEASIQADPYIQQMLQQFGAVIREDTIKPVDPPAVQAQ